MSLKNEKKRAKRIKFKNWHRLGTSNKVYVLQPYQLVKDVRSKIENTNPASVLDGNIDEFIEEGIKVR